MDRRGRGVLGVYGIEWSGFVGKDHQRCVISSGEQNVGGMCIEKASGRVERGMQQITEIKVLGSFSRKYSLC